MNIEQAKAIPLVSILDNLNYKPKKTKHHEVWYLSPLRNEKTASFKVDTKKNTWYDFGEGVGGDIIDFACAYLKSTGESHTIADALRWLKNMGGFTSRIEAVTPEHDTKPDSTLRITAISQLNRQLLFDYLKSRGIEKPLAEKWFKELTIHNKKSGKTFYATGFPNDNGGYEVRNQFFKSCIGSKDIRFIRGSNPLREGINIFEGSMDYVSVLAKLGASRMADDVLVLNSTACLPKATPMISGYPYKKVFSWMDNDATGEKASKSLQDFVQTQNDMRLLKMNHLYAGHKDVNAWYMNQLGLQ